MANMQGLMHNAEVKRKNIQELDNMHESGHYTETGTM